MVLLLIVVTHKQDLKCRGCFAKTEKPNMPKIYIVVRLHVVISKSYSQVFTLVIP